MKRLCTLLFWGCLVGVLFFTLRPVSMSNRGRELPPSLRHWINAHDAWANLGAFAVFGLVALSAEGRWPWANNQTPEWLADRRWRLGLLLALAAAVEVVQIWIPGRVCDWKDIGACWSGLGLAWVGWRWQR